MLCLEVGRLHGSHCSQVCKVCYCKHPSPPAATHSSLQGVLLQTPLPAPRQPPTQPPRTHAHRKSKVWKSASQYLSTSAGPSLTNSWQDHQQAPQPASPKTAAAAAAAAAAAVAAEHRRGRGAGGVRRWARAAVGLEVYQWLTGWGGRFPCLGYRCWEGAWISSRVGCIGGRRGGSSSRGGRGSSWLVSSSFSGVFVMGVEGS